VRAIVIADDAQRSQTPTHNEAVAQALAGLDARGIRASGLLNGADGPRAHQCA